MRWRALFLGLLASVALQVAGGGTGGAQDEYLQRVLAAARGGDEASLRTLAKKPQADPWIVVDRLDEGGLAEAARVYAGALETPRAEALRSFVRRFPLDEDDARRRVDSAASQLRPGGWRDAAARLEGEPPTAPTVTSVRWHANRGRALTALGQDDLALALYERAIREARALGWLRGEDHAWHGRFWVLRVLHRYDDALAALGERRRIAGLLGDAKIEAYADHAQAALHIDLGEAWSAVPLLERVIPWFDTHGPRRMAGEARALLAVAEGRRGNYAPALTAAQSAAQIAHETKDGPRHFDALHTQSGILLDMGQYEQAVRIVDRLLAGPGVPPERQAQLLANRAMANAYLGNTEEARKDFKSALRMVPSEEDDAWARWFRMMRSLTLHLGLQAWASAEADARAAIRPAEAAEETNGWSRYALGASLIGQGRLGEARDQLERAHQIAEELDILDLRMFVRVRLGEVGVRSGDPAAGIRWSRAAVGDLDLIAAGLADDEGVALRADVERARLFTIWRTSAGQLPEARRASALFEAMEASRSRLLLAAMGGSHLARGLDLPPELQALEHRAQRRLLTTREAYLRSRRRSMPRARQRAARDRLAEARTAWLGVVAQVQRMSGARAALAYPAAAKLADYQRALRGDEATVLYDVVGMSPRALVVTKTKAVVVPLPSWSDAAEAYERTTSRDNLRNPIRFRGDLASLRTALVDALKLPSTIRRLHLCPDGPLTAMPWPALFAGTSITPLLTPSASTMVALRRRGAAPAGRRLLVGDPLYTRKAGGRTIPWGHGATYLPRLTHSGDEVRGLRREGDLLLTRELATESRIKRELGVDAGWDVIHLAGHGFCDPRLPSLTCIALSPSDRDDGFLTAAEVFALRARTDLVVLSACDVGRAEYAEGAGVLGMVRAFMAAGAQGVLASLWPADDEATAYLMQQFHLHRSGGLSTHAALLRAQAAVRSRKSDKGTLTWSDPYYWAGWVVWGTDTNE